MINGFHEEKGDTAFKFASIILAMMALFVICMYVVIQVDSNSRTLDTKLKTTGIRRGLKVFLSSYSYDYENLENIAEGYLKPEDLTVYGDGTGKGSNPVLVNSADAMGKFIAILSDNCGVSEEEIRNWNFQIVELHQVFQLGESEENLERENYLVTYYTPQKIGYGCTVQKDENTYSSATAVSKAIVDHVCGGKAQADLASDVYKTIHTKVTDKTYARDGINKKTAATYTTFFFIGMNIPSKPVFGKKTDVTFLDLQSFSNQR